VTGPDERRSGLYWGIAAYGLWGLFVFYFKAVAHVAPMEVLAHRIIWSVVFLGILLGFRGRWRENLATALKPRALGLLSITTVLIALNWFTFIWAVGNDQTVQASLGYFINPLVNVLLGFVFLRERHSRLRWLSVAIAAFAVGLLIFRQGTVPVVALVLAFSFGFYGLLRKIMPVDSLVGLTVETKLLLPFAIAYLAVLGSRGEMAFLAVDRSTDVLLLSAGVLTATPLLCFANAARRLDYATVGLLQYIAPTLQFAIAVKIFGEALNPVQLVSFGLIWVALALYSWDALRRRRKRSSGLPPAG
jgi:chloramphenicol-sensitive protein RarD